MILCRNRYQEVPDTQEVFRYNRSDALIVVEVIQRVEPTDNHEAVRYLNSTLRHTAISSAIADSSSTN